jgi:CheY-like chemotaxis protein
MAKGKILLVDDDADMRSSLQAILEGRDYDVVTADSREEGLAKFESERPDLAILDVMMATWQDGFEMARQVKQDSRLKDIPILMLTGVKGKSGIDFKTNAGDETWLPVDAFLDKPVDSEILVAEVERLLGNS